MELDNRITSIEDVPADTTFLFTVRAVDTDDEHEAILTCIDGEITGWLNYCRHFTHIRLDKGSGAVMRDGEIVCTNHGAMFEAATGLCTFGPCSGAYLESIDVATEDGDVYLTDPAYTFVDVGPADDEFDLSSSSNIEF